MWDGLRSHFNRQNWGDQIMILEDHPNSLPRCERCRIQVPAGRLSNIQSTSEKCKQGEERRLRRENLQRCFEASRVLLYINANTLPPSEASPYLGLTITFNNSNWAAVYLNLRKDRMRWGMIARVLERTGATVRARGAM